MVSPSLRLHRVLQHVSVSASAAGSTNANADGIYAEMMYRGGEDPKICRVVNARGAGHTVERDGFELSAIQYEKAVGVDLYDTNSCRAHMYPLVETVLKTSFPSSTKVVVFDHILRNPSAPNANANPLLSGQYGRNVHGDYTVRSGFTRARSLLEPHESKERIENAISQRFAFVNVWVPLKKVERTPLGLIEWDSTVPRDVVTAKLMFQHRIGAELYRVNHSESHRWVYYPDMTPGECIVFKTFDSALDGRARFVLHGAFEDPTSSPNAPPRESMELRCIVFFGDLPSDFASKWPNQPDLVMQPDRVEFGPITDEW